MIVNKIQICVFILLTLFLWNVKCEGNVSEAICTTKTMVLETRSVPVSYTVIERYRTNCWYGSCTKTRRRYESTTRRYQLSVPKFLKHCCSGYIKIEEEDSGSAEDEINCKPICAPSCSNGYCKSPGICECNDGYVVDPNSTHNCLPKCDQDCDHGHCIGPNICNCSVGYSMSSNSSCDPICSEPCENGKCVAPDTCECNENEGYRKSENNTCEPYCSTGCGSGKCVKPEVCTCEEGYRFDNQNCVPHCSNFCGNGTCIAPETCECNSGYVKVNETCQPYCPEKCNHGYCSAPSFCTCDPGYSFHWGNCYPNCSHDCGKYGTCIAPDVCECIDGYRATNSCDPYCCQPVCSNPCIHGSCDEPEMCYCDDGYENKDRYTCVPTCAFDCGNGTCTAPDTCECHSGFKERENETEYEEYVCAPICKNCEGKCVAPYTCECGESFVKKDETMDGEDCDCFVNCSDTSKQCERTVCVFVSTTEETSKLTNNIDNRNMYVDFRDPNELDPSTDFSEEGEELDEAKLNGDSTSDLLHSANTGQNRFPVWEVAIGIITIVVIITLMIVVIKTNVLLNYIRGGSYVVHDKSDDTNLTSHSSDMRLSTLEKNKAESYR